MGILVNIIYIIVSCAVRDWAPLRCLVFMVFGRVLCPVALGYAPRLIRLDSSIGYYVFFRFRPVVFRLSIVDFCGSVAAFLSPSLCLLVANHLPLVAGYWLLATGYWLLVTG